MTKKKLKAGDLLYVIDIYSDKISIEDVVISHIKDGYATIRWKHGGYSYAKLSEIDSKKDRFHTSYSYDLIKKLLIKNIKSSEEQSKSFIKQQEEHIRKAKKHITNHKLLMKNLDKVTDIEKLNKAYIKYRLNWRKINDN